MQLNYTLNFENSNLEKRVEKYCQVLQNLPHLWASKGYKGKLELQELMFPKGIVYDREISNYRTTEINEVAFAMSEIARDIEGNEKGDLGNFYLKSPSVQGKVTLSNQINTYLAKIDNLKYIEMKPTFHPTTPSPI